MNSRCALLRACLPVVMPWVSGINIFNLLLSLCMIWINKQTNSSFICFHVCSLDWPGTGYAAKNDHRLLICHLSSTSQVCTAVPGYEVTGLEPRASCLLASQAPADRATAPGRQVSFEQESLLCMTSCRASCMQEGSLVFLTLHLEALRPVPASCVWVSQLHGSIWLHSPQASC